MLSSFISDYCARLKIGGTHLSGYIINQLPVLPPSVFSDPAPWDQSQSLADWLKPLVLELTYTARDLAPFARDLGYAGEPFPWDEERRAILRAKIDAAFFRLYLRSDGRGGWLRAENESDEDFAELIKAFPTPRDAVAYVMETFPITKKKDEAKYGSFRTKDLILAEYDKLF